ncbi:MAG: hypothetical protein IPF52_10955 [Saprospiraceae bacterium]|nr:hypothetical protein [Saprospiraceae bacterium]
MTKEEMIEKIEILKRRVKTLGRAYSKDQREEMRKEISNLSIELGKIKFQEDLIFISEFEININDFYEAEKNDLRNQINSLSVGVTDEDLKYILEYKIKSFNSKISLIENTQKQLNY